MKFIPSLESHVEVLSTWFLTKEEIQNWGGPLLRFPIILDQFKKDIGWDIVTSYSLLDNNELIGFVQVFDKFGYKHIGRVSIDPSKRGMGLGARLIKELFLEYKNCQKAFSLFVYKDNVIAKNMYEKLGFEICDESKEYCMKHNCYFMKSK